MNLSNSDYKQLESKLDEAMAIAKDFWIDPDYTRDIEERVRIIECIKDTKNYVRRFFHPNN